MHQDHALLFLEQGVTSSHTAEPWGFPTSEQVIEAYLTPKLHVHIYSVVSGIYNPVRSTFLTTDEVHSPPQINRSNRIHLIGQLLNIIRNDVTTIKSNHLVYKHTSSHSGKSVYYLQKISSKFK